jgi:hypothetical protein
MSQAAENAPMFIEAFYDACETLREADETAVPSVARMNRVLAKNQAGYEIRPPRLVAQNPQTPVAVPTHAPSLDEQARELVQQSLNDSERLLSEGKYRQAIQEILWLLETVSTAFQGLETDAGTVQGNYFNRIVQDLAKAHRGQTLEKAVTWIMNLHGYLSSPTGGGVRHGTSLREAVEIGPHEARLFCNLIRSYITFLLATHERLSQQ